MLYDIQSSTVYARKDKEKIQVPVKRCGICVHTHTHTHTEEYYSVLKKNANIASKAVWMNLEIIILNEASQTERHII